MDSECDSDASDGFPLDLQEVTIGEDRDCFQPGNSAADIDSSDSTAATPSSYEWASVDNNFSLPTPKFNRFPGLTYNAKGFREINFFGKVFGNDLISAICDQSNLYAEQRNLNIHMSSSDFLKVLALQIYMGLNQKSQVYDHWGTSWQDYNPFISKIISKNDFAKFSQILHFNDNSRQPDRNSADHDPVYKVRPLLDYVDKSFWNYYTPQQELAIDESMIGFKGRISFLQYIPSKRTRFGVKCWVLAESKTGYILRFYIYTGKTSYSTKGDSLGESVVLTLLTGLAHSGHIIFTDNFYSSPKLFSRLKSIGLGACGTVRLGRKGLPPHLAKKEWQLKRCDGPKFLRSTNNLLLCAWVDKKQVLCLSTFYNSSVVEKDVRSKDPSRRLVVKPAVIDLYNQFMGGVDLADMKMHFYSYPHGVKKWYKRIYHHIVEQCLHNATISYNCYNFDQPITSLNFRRHLVDQLLQAAQLFVPDTRVLVSSENQSHAVPPISVRFSGRHYLKPSPQRGYCICCSSTTHRVRVSTVCKQCSVFICMYPCHEKFHEDVDYKWERKQPKRLKHC